MEEILSKEILSAVSSLLFAIWFIIAYKQKPDEWPDNPTEVGSW